MDFNDFKVYFLSAGSILIVSVNTVQTYLQIAVAGISIFYTGLRIFQIIKQNGKDNK